MKTKNRPQVDCKTESGAIEALKTFAASRGKAQAVNPRKAKPRATSGSDPEVSSASPAPLPPAVAPAVAAPVPVPTVVAPTVAAAIPEPAAEPKTEQNPESKAEREAKFLEIYLTGEHSINDSMKLAGYADMTDRNRHYIAKGIIQRHEQGAGDSRKLLRAAGLGEIKVALEILELMKSNSQTVRVRACELAARCLGMAKEGAELPQGITIVIKGRIRQSRSTPAALHLGPPHLVVKRPGARAYQPPSLFV